MNGFDLYDIVSDLQLEPTGYIMHLDGLWPSMNHILKQLSLKIKNVQYPGELTITDDLSDNYIDLYDNNYYSGVSRNHFHMSLVAIDVRALYNCSCLRFDLSVRNAYWIERETRIILTGLNRTVDMRIESVRNSNGLLYSEYQTPLQNLLFGLYNIFNNKLADRFLFDTKSVYTTNVVKFFAELYLRFHETDFRTFNMDNSLLFKQAIYEYSPEELERIISMCLNVELMEEYITSEHTSGECKAIVIKRMAELEVDNNRFDL